MHKLNIDTQHLQSASSEEVHTPTENDLLISRLVARIAELEERLYKKELEAPAVGKLAVLPKSRAPTSSQYRPPGRSQKLPQSKPSPSRKGTLGPLASVLSPIHHVDTAAPRLHQHLARPQH